MIDYAHVHHELHKSTATLELLLSGYQEAVAARGDGLKPYQYSQFCELYGAWRVCLEPSMRRVHLAGEKAFLDYSGKKPKIFDREAGEERELELFVMVLGASNYTYAEATLTQSLRDFAGSTIRGFEHFGGVPDLIVPDQFRSAVKGPDRYEQLSFDEKLGLVADREWTDRDNRRLARRIKEAKLVTRASLDNVLCDPERGAVKATMRSEAVLKDNSGNWFSLVQRPR